ncbi:hypothetical protein [Nocardia mikamii]|uniref:hypothetical protein n=1 Tax=Nocardia mikamii TaxID=508464 RepID=UPI0007A50D60|nr:hypothetical protein [Nocardia mikamii]
MDSLALEIPCAARFHGGAGALPPHVLHLDCALGLVREGLLAACPDRLPDGLPEPLRDWGSRVD